MCIRDRYGSDPALTEFLGLDRQWLHAVHLGFTHPNGSWMDIESPYSADLREALDRLREVN